MKMSLANLISKCPGDYKLPEIYAIAMELMQSQADKWVTGTAYNVLARRPRARPRMGNGCDGIIVCHRSRF